LQENNMKNDIPQTNCLIFIDLRLQS